MIAWDIDGQDRHTMPAPVDLDEMNGTYIEVVLRGASNVVCVALRPCVSVNVPPVISTSS